MKKLTLTAAIAVVLAGALTACSKPNDNEPMNNNAQSSPAMMEQNNADTSVTRADSAETSLDWAGEYEGVFPSADYNWFLDGYVYPDPDMNFDQASFAQWDWNNLNTGFDQAVQFRFLNYPIRYTSLNYLAESS